MHGSACLDVATMSTIARVIISLFENLITQARKIKIKLNAGREVGVLLPLQSRSYENNANLGAILST